MNREDIMTLVERYALAMKLAERHGNQYGDRDMLIHTHNQIRQGLKALVAFEREAVIAIVNDNSDSDGVCCTDNLLAAIRARGDQ